MAFSHTFRLSSHAVITNSNNDVLQLKANYGDFGWGLPGGALDPGETIHEALKRECAEELNCTVIIDYLSGVYYHEAYNSQAFIFRCHLRSDAHIRLSDEHSDYQYTNLNALSTVQRRRVSDCLDYSGVVTSAKF